MNYSKLSNSELLSLLENKSSEERAATAEIVRLLREVDRRRLYAELGFGSLFDYCVKALKYSGGAAYRRINAMRLLKDLPELDEKIASGAVSLMSAATLQTFFRNESKQAKKYTVDEKRALLKSVESKTKRETDALLFSLSPTSATPPERERPLNENLTEIRFVANKALLRKLEKLKGLISHKNPDRSYEGLFEALADMALKTLDPEQKRQRSAASTTQRDSTVESPCVKGKSKYIPAAVRREVWKRDKGKCTFEHPLTGQRCESCYQLEIDHIEPLALGGESTLENLRLLCRRHNQLRAIRMFGEPLRLPSDQRLNVTGIQ